MPAGGITMVLDKGLGIRELEDLLEVAGNYFHFLKLGFGTAGLYREEVLRRKTSLARSFGVEVYPGGTFLEIALAQGEKIEHLLERFLDLGFSAVEISEGTVSWERRMRERLIKLARQEGFTVLTEVGKKNPLYPFDPAEIARQIAADLEAGAHWVIIEGREQGRRAGIYDAQGRIKEGIFRSLLEKLEDPSRLIWEAPLPSQQLALIRHLGPEVNLGNVPPGEVLSLAALRRGLRSDTFFLLERLGARPIRLVRAKLG
ncbi:phosphosulfolactate synthase [Ammonifex thiophilus]|uniref:Phosphosulfolactate synthase n=1 Tax=Ammonifex thiophilus TaxID=444093 RepID=A0A3D8P4J6_9THEO|nr:phosphosulfolactate synthase [Ammonifex thiophilus]RDV82868.1 phosphosulfolactate synthase [Ammonifex thiophilus]